MVRVAVAVGVVVLIVAGFLLFRDGGPDPEPPRPGAAFAGADVEVPDVVADEAGITLGGRVLLLNDTPVPDATVHLTDATSRKTAAIDAVRTGPGGRFEFPAVTPGSYVVSALSDSGGAGYVPLVRVPGPEPVTVTVRITSKSAWISGRVVDETGGALVGVKVNAHFTPPGSDLLRHLGMKVTPQEGVTPWVVTGAEGGFRVGPVPPGRGWLLADGGERGTGHVQAVAPSDDVLIRLARAARVTGTVTVEGTEPPEKVSVILEPGGRTVEIAPGPGTTPFEIAWLPPGAYRVTARAREFRVARSGEFEVKRGETAGPIAVTLRPGVLVHGTVRNPAGEPIPGARIALFRRTLQHGRQTTILKWPWAPVRTDAKGRYRIRLEPGSWEVYAHLHGYVPPAKQNGAERNIAVGEATVCRDFVLAPTSRVTGIVRDSSGRPVKGVTVTIRGEWLVLSYGRVEGGRSVGTDSEVTDQEGRFRFVNLATDASATLTIWGLDEPVDMDLEFPDGEDRLDLDIRVIPPRAVPEPEPGVLRGRVVDEAGSPLAGVLVKASLGGMTITGREGTFTLGRVGPGEQGIRYAALGYALGMAEGIVVRPGEQDVGDLVLRREGTVLNGTVTDTTGVPVAGVEVTAHFTNVGTPRFGFDLPFRTTTGPKGAYRINGPAVHAARVHIRLSKPGFNAAGKRTTVEGGVTLDFTLVAGCRIRGTLAFAGEAPKAIYLAAIGMVRGIHNTHEIGVKWDAATGTFVAAKAPAGQKRIRISAAGYAPILTAEYDLVPGRELVLPEITMSPGGTLAGTILDAAGKPVPAARLTVWIPDRGMGGRADERGRFRIENVPPGAWKLQANHPEVHRVRTVPVRVEDGAVTTLDVRLPEK